MQLYAPWGFCWRITLFLLNIMYVYPVKDNNPWLIWTYRSLSVNIKEKAAALNHRCVRSDNLSLIYVLEIDIKAMSYSNCYSCDSQIGNTGNTALWCVQYLYVSVLCDAGHHSLLCIWSPHWAGTLMWVNKSLPHTLVFFLFCSTQINPNKHIESDFDLIRPGREMPNALHEFAEKEQKSQFSE